MSERATATGFRLTIPEALVSLLTGLIGAAALVGLGAKLSPLMAFGALLGCLLQLVLIRYPSLGLILTAAVVPLERLGRLTDDSSAQTISLMRLIGLAALVGLVVNVLVRRERFRLGTALWLYAGYTAIAAASIAYSTDRVGSVRAVGAILANILFFFLVINLARDRRLVHMAIGVWLAATVAAGVYSIADWHFGSGAEGGMPSRPDPGRGVQTTDDRFATVWEDQAELESLSGKRLRRSMGPTSHAAVWGINLILTVPFFFYLFRQRRGRGMALWLVLGLLVIFYNVFLTNTRAVILLAGLVLVICAVRKLIVVRPGVLVSAAVLLACVPLFVPGDVFNRVLDLSNYTPEKSASLRIRMAYLDAGLAAFQDNWWRGIGVGNQEGVPAYIQTEAPDLTTVHNEYLQTAMEVGLFGWLLFFAFVSLLLYYAFAVGKDLRGVPGRENDYWLMVACQVAMLSVLVFGLQVDVFHFPLKGWWLVAGLTVVMFRFGRAESPRLARAHLAHAGPGLAREGK